jgi:Tol biopolymer transport system component
MERRILRGGATSCVVLSCLATTAAAQEVTRESVDSNGVEADSYSERGAISGDGRISAFVSNASNLVPGDTIGDDVFVHDRTTGVTTMVSVNSKGQRANQRSTVPSISGDGLWVVFVSNATNLDPFDIDFRGDVYVHSLQTGKTRCVSVDANGIAAGGGWPSLSADGKLVAFNTIAALNPRDINFDSDIYVRDLATGVNELVSVSSSGAIANGGSGWPAISGDGRFVAFESLASNLVANDSNRANDVFVHDRSTGVTERVSVDSSGLQGNDHSSACAINADGSFVMFMSYATNLVPNDNNLRSDVFVRDRVSGTTERVSVDSSGAEGNGHSSSGSISGDGQFAAFDSLATNLVPVDTSGHLDVFVHDRSSGATTIVSRDCSGLEADGDCTRAKISADGEHVVFESWASDLVDGDANYSTDIFVNDWTIHHDASWQNYDAGYPGTLGVPSLTASADPEFGATISVLLGNSKGSRTAGVLLFGFTKDSIPTVAGGTLLVDAQLFIPVTVPAWGASLSGTIPRDRDLCGVSCFLQGVELDSGAAYGLSFTAGLELVIGQ